ncbi:hypothetical protein D3C78_1517780 [compost metagenome]
MAWLPATGVKGAEAASGPTRMPVRTLLSLASTSVSLVSRLPLGSTPGMLLKVPPASMAMALSLTAVGSSLRPTMVTVSVAELVAPVRSRML